MKPSTTHRSRRTAALIVTCALIATACGGDDDDGSADEPSAADESAEEPAGEEVFDEDAEMYRTVTTDQKSALTTALDDAVGAEITQECQVGYDEVGVRGQSIQIGGTEPEGADSVTVGETTFYRIDAADAGAPNHYFWLHPIHRGHPVDDLEKVQQRFHDPDPAGGGSSVVIDVLSDAEVRHPEHGEFVVSVIEGAGGEAELLGVPESRNAGESIVFDEWAVLTALAGIDVAQIPLPDVIVMPFGTFGCGGANDPEPSGGPEALRVAVTDLSARGITLVASAGNDSTNQLVFPAAFGNVAAVGSLHNDENRSCFTNFGSWVKYWAIGEEVLGFNDEYTWSGTSFAAPQVGAVFAAGGSPTEDTTLPDVGPDNGYGCDPEPSSDSTTTVAEESSEDVSSDS